MQILLTDRLIIREARLADADFFLDLLNSPNWKRFIGDRGLRTHEEAANYIQKSLIESYRENGYGLYTLCLKEGESVIGICGFVKRPYLEHADLGFALLPVYEGNGYVYEAAKALRDYGKQNLELDPLLAITTEENLRSRNLLVKLGFREKDTICPGDGKIEFLLYSTFPV